MATKLKAAKLAKSQGIPTAIVSGSDLKSMYRLLEGEDDAIYAARLVDSGWDCGLDEEGVRANFALISGR